jgi:hypothetical protein
MKFYLTIIFIFILIFSLHYFINRYISNKKYENFTNIYGARPIEHNSKWSHSKKEDIDINNACDVGSICFTPYGFGVFNKYCKCIVGLQKNNVVEEELCQPIQPPPKKPFKFILPIKKQKKEKIKVDLSDCYPNNSDFAEICKNENPNFGVKEIIKCDKDNSKVLCGLNYFNGTHHGNGNGEVVTPCLNKNEDFDVWCKYYNNKPIPKGFNINSISAKKILYGKEGDCKINEARAICDFDHLETITKLEPANKKINYNKFTSCFPLNRTDFKRECSYVLNNDYNNSSAVQITGYDCMPGYGRAKCLINKDNSSGFNEFNSPINQNTNIYNFNKEKDCECS